MLVSFESLKCLKPKINLVISEASANMVYLLFCLITYDIFIQKWEENLDIPNKSGKAKLFGVCVSSCEVW